MKRIFSAALLVLPAFLAGCAESDPYMDAETLLARKRYSPAIVSFSELLAEDPSSTRALIGRGRAYVASGRFDRALEDYGRAIEIDPNDPEPYYRRAKLFELAGEAGKARLDEKTAHELDPKYREAFAAMENAMLPVMDEEDEDFVADEDAKSSDASARRLRVAHDEDEATPMAIALPTFQSPSSSRFDLTTEDRARASTSLKDPFSTSTPFDVFRDPLMSSPQSAWQSSLGGEKVTQSPLWMAPKPTPPATTSTTTKPTATATATPTKSLPLAPVARAPNPYVKAPAPTPTSAPPAATPRTATPSAATGGAPTISSPFPQAPAVRTGR